MKNLPPIRNENIVVQEAGEEVLVYDLLSDKVFSLNKTSAGIYNACGNSQTFKDLKRKYNFTDDLIYFALDELNKNNLLAEKYESPLSKINRREVIKKVGLASMVALPVITSLIAPKAAQAASSCSAIGQACSADPLFTQGNCCADFRCSPFLNSCVVCRQSNTIFASTNCSFESQCFDICDTHFTKNNCCSSGTASHTYNPTTGGSQSVSCLCP